MERSEIRVFIVDDDPTLSKAMAEVVKKTGFQAIVCHSPTEAQNQYRIQGAQLFIIDCLLPKMSGVDLAVKIKAESVSPPPVILTSGIFKDKTFIKESISKTGAVKFLPKPFDLKELESAITNSLIDVVDVEVSPLESFLFASKTPGEKIKLINTIDDAEGYEIPWICWLLLNPNISGTLQLSNTLNTSNIFFSRGRVNHVEMESPESLFGRLLVEKGYVSLDELERAAATRADKRIGEKLVDAHLISPHVINIINGEQTAIRLSRLISDKSYSVSFSATESEPNPPSIDSEDIASYVSDWVNSKIPITWLKQKYLKWFNARTILLRECKPGHPIWNFWPLKDAPELVKEFESGKSLGQVLEKGRFSEDLTYQVFHVLILIGHILLKREARAFDETVLLDRLKKIWAEMQNQDYFANLGLSRNAKPHDIKKTYYELAKIFHPDKIPEDATSELKDLAKKVFGQMVLAHETLADDQKRAQYNKQLEMGQAEKILQAEMLMEEGKGYLRSGQAVRAKEKFESAASVNRPSSELLIHLAWAKIICAEMDRSSHQLLFQAEATLSKIPPEDRHNHVYYFVKGLYLKARGDIEAAKKNIQHALSLNSKFIEAERVLRTIEPQKSFRSGILSGDLTSVMGKILRKK